MKRNRIVNANLRCLQ